MVEAHIAALSRFLDLEQPYMHREQALSNDQAHAALIAELLLKGKGAKLDKAASDVLTDDFLDAIEDLPAWAIREARRKWNRGESVQIDPKKPHDFTWRIEPPTLRYLARVELAGIKWEIRKLERLLSATVRPTEEQLAAGRAAMRGLAIRMKTGSVGDLTFEQAVTLGNEAPQLPAPAAHPTDAYQGVE